MKFQHLLSIGLASRALAQDDGDSEDTSSQNITQIIEANNDTLSSLGALLATQPSLVEDLADMENITILAPDNDALEAFLDGTSIEDVDPSMVMALLMYHVLNGTYTSDLVEEGMPMFLPTMLGNETYENVTGSQVVEVMKEGDTVSFVSGLKTVSNVTMADVNFTGGVIHVINEVLEIPKMITETASAAGLTALIGALTAADIAENLTMLEDVTIFAPSNAAFAAIGSLSEDIDEEMLMDILAYHVINGTVAYSSDLEGGMVETMGGEEVNIQIEDGEVYVNSAKVILADVLVANGVVHVIDGVLNPENPSATADPSASTMVPAFEGASTASGGEIPFTTGVSAPTETVSELAPAPEETDNVGARPTAAIAVGALFGGAVLMANQF